MLNRVMIEDVSFQDLMTRVRAGDQDAAADLVRECEPEIIQAIRGPMNRLNLHRHLDPDDICQAVLANFFIRTAAGQFELKEPRDVIKLLVKMARNKVFDEARHHRADRRDDRRVVEASGVDDEHCLSFLAAETPTPSKIVAGHELLAEMRRLFTEEERYLAEQRALGVEWAILAKELGENADTLRKRLARAVDRVSKQLQIDTIRLSKTNSP